MTQPHYQDGQVTLHHSDGLDVLRTLPDESVSAVITDPPYGLSNLKPDQVTAAVVAWANGDRDRVPNAAGFMGRDWDAFVPPPAVWDECLRVLKPGGHLACFAAPRTMDLMGLSIRLAGFEIRDGIGTGLMAWVFGSGFPKGQDIGKAIDRARDDRTDIVRVTSWLAEHAERRGITRADVDAHMGTSDMGGWWLSRLRHRCQVPKWDQWLRLRDLLGFGGEMDAEVWRLNGRKGTPGEAWDQREVIGQRERKATGRMAQGEGGYAFGESFDETAPATPEAQQWDGWNTSLKPAWEPIILARKPLAGTVAANVLAHGTGALNVDATRVSPSSPERDAPASGRRSHPDSPLGTSAASPAPAPGSLPCTCAEQPACSTDGTSLDRESGEPRHTPSTLVPEPADDSREPRTDPPASAPVRARPRLSPQDSRDDCPTSPRSCGGRAPTAEVDAQAVPQPLRGAPACPGPGDTPGRTQSSSRSMACPQHTAQHVQPPGRWPTNVLFSHSPLCAEDCDPSCPVAELDAQSVGTRAAKASASGNRKAPHRTGSMSGALGAHVNSPDVVYDDSGGASRFFPVFRYQAKAPARERPKIDGVAHPTTKPVGIMTWLARLLCPPGGTILDPFTGSGTTIEAAMLEGFDVIGIEREVDYLPLIEQRITRAHATLATLATAAEQASAQPDGLFDIPA